MKLSAGQLEREAISKAAVIIVLGARVLEGGLPSPALKRRVAHAVDLYWNDPSKFLLVSGGVGRHPPSESAVMKKLAQSTGIPSNRIITEGSASSTMQNAAGCARIMQKYGWSTAVIVTDRYHLKRSLLAFRHFGISAIGSPPKGKREDCGSIRRGYFLARELLALGWYWLRVQFDRLF